MAHTQIPTDQAVARCLAELNGRHERLCREMDPATAAYLVPRTLATEGRFGTAIVDQALDRFLAEHPIPDSELARIKEVIRQLRRKDQAYGAILGVFLRALKPNGHVRAYEEAMAATFPNVATITPELLESARAKFAQFYLSQEAWSPQNAAH
jgi:hypothetical protein